MNWKFENLPREEFNNVLDLIEKENAAALLRIHNRYKLSGNDYCCHFEKAVLGWYRWAVRKKLIYKV